MIEGRLGKYEILASLSQGGMADIHVARRQGADHPCVLKRLRLSMLKHEIALKRFVREAAVASQLNHRYIARVLDAGTEDDVFYIAMEYIQGQTASALFEALRKRGKRLPFTMAVGIVLRVLEGLEYAHTLQDAEGESLNIVHRDLSPRNIMIDYEGQTKIIDFGLVKANATETLTRSGVLLGTPRYMSPEQACGERTDLRTDIYALSVVLYELVSGHPVVKANNPVEALRQVVERTPTSLSEVAPEVPPALAAVISKGMEKERGARWSSAREYRAAIEAVCGSMPEVEGHLKNLVCTIFSEERIRDQRFFSQAHTMSEEEEELSGELHLPTRLGSLETDEEPSAELTVAQTSITQMRDFEATRVAEPEVAALADTAYAAPMEHLQEAAFVTPAFPPPRSPGITKTTLLVGMLGSGLMSALVALGVAFWWQSKQVQPVAAQLDSVSARSVKPTPNPRRKPTPSAPTVVSKPTSPPPVPSKPVRRRKPRTPNKAAPPKAPPAAVPAPKPQSARWRAIERKAQAVREGDVFKLVGLCELLTQEARTIKDASARNAMLAELQRGCGKVANMDEEQVFEAKRRLRRALGH